MSKAADHSNQQRTTKVLEVPPFAAELTAFLALSPERSEADRDHRIPQAESVRYCRRTDDLECSQG